MKKAKKMLLAASALALVSFGLIGCGEEDDDVNEMIEKKNSKNYSVSFTNDLGKASRGYKTTSLKHEGAQMEFVFTDVAATSEAGVLGLVWELETVNKDTNARNFFVLGIRQKNGVPYYYISKFTNVTDINAENFGTKLKENPAVETELVKAFQAIDGKSWKNNADDTMKVYADIKAVVKGYEVQFYKTEDDLTAGQNGVLASPKEITSTVLGSDGKPDERDLGVYTNVYGVDANGNKKIYTLKGSWRFIGTYKDAEVAEAE